MELGKIKIDKWFLDSLAHHKEEGWKLTGVTKKDEEGFYWLILQKGVGS